MKTNKKSVIAILSGCCLITLLSGCASVLCGPQQQVSINSRPAGAEVIIYNARGDIVAERTTPCVAKLDRRSPDYMESANYVVLIRKEGYAPVQIPLSGVVNRAYFANIIFGGLGLIIDPATGSMWTLSPSAVNANFASESAMNFTHSEGLMVVLKEELPQELVGYLEPVQK
jgi:hypothetical protein